MDIDSFPTITHPILGELRIQETPGPVFHVRVVSMPLIPMQRINQTREYFTQINWNNEAYGFYLNTTTGEWEARAATRHDAILGLEHGWPWIMTLCGLASFVDGPESTSSTATPESIQTRVDHLQSYWQRLQREVR